MVKRRKSILKRTRRRTPARRKRSKRRRKKQIKRPYKRDALKRHARRHKRRSQASAVHGHHGRMYKEAEVSNYLMNQLLKTAASTEGDPYHYEPRHHSKDPEYTFSGGPMKEFKQGVPAPDVHFWRPQGKGMPPSRGNYPNWQPVWEHPHVGI